jgi:hypothetical protein
VLGALPRDGRTCLDPDLPAASSSPSPLTAATLRRSAAPLAVFCAVPFEGHGIEDDHKAMLKADFANKYLGGGVLHKGVRAV